MMVNANLMFFTVEFSCTFSIETQKGAMPITVHMSAIQLIKIRICPDRRESLSSTGQSANVWNKSAAESTIHSSQLEQGLEGILRSRLFR